MCIMNARTTLCTTSAAICAIAFSLHARAADDLPEGDGAASETPRTSATSTAIVAHTYATGVARGQLGAMGYGSGLVSGGSSTWAGGATAWGSPVDRLTIVADAQRDVNAQFAPSVAALVRLVGAPGRGFSFGVIGKYKVDGFARGPNNEFESEAETGALLSLHEGRFHLDTNAIGGVGLTDDREVDAEGRLRVGIDVTSFLRLGIDEQARWRVSGATKLPGNRSWDYAGGAQVLVSFGGFFGALTAGPTTMGVYDSKAGWMAMMTLGAVTL
jgi:hypothetical protein